MSELRDKLLYKPKHGLDRLSEAEVQNMEAYCKSYMDFLDHGKTERDCVDYAVASSPTCPAWILPPARRST